MTYTNQTLSQQIYKMFGWDDDQIEHIWVDGSIWNFKNYSDWKSTSKPAYIPAYDLGYLIRKLPDYSKIRKQDDKYYADAHGTVEPFVADTPEEAAGLLLLELGKQNIIKGEN